MTRQQAIEQLTAELTKHIDGFFEQQTQSDPTPAYEAMGWVGEDLSRLMAKAAMATWEASADVQDFIQKEGIDLGVTA